MPENILGNSGGVLRVVSPDERNEMDEKRFKHDDAVEQAKTPAEELASYVRKEWAQMRDYRSTESINQRLLMALRQYRGEYDSATLREIQAFGGSDVYAQLTTMKCRGATSLLRDVYLGADRPWTVKPTPDPELPESIQNAVNTLLMSEIQTITSMGGPVTEEMIVERKKQLYDSAKQAAIKKARKLSLQQEDVMDDYLVEGGFYDALSSFLIDLPIYPFAVIKGPVWRNKIDVEWDEQGNSVVNYEPKMCWERVSPFDFWWSGGVGNIEDGSVMERSRVTRVELQDMIGLKGYFDDEIKAALEEHQSQGLLDWQDETDSEAADLQNKENPQLNRSHMISIMEYYGSIPGNILKDMNVKGVTDVYRDYFCQVLIVGSHVIKAILYKDPARRPPYYVSSFEKVPGSVVGMGLPDLIHDIQDVCNASLRSLVNNLSISSGPQVVIDVNRMVSPDDSDDLYPWKRWHVQEEPMGSNAGRQPAINFYQPQSNAQELMSVYQAFTRIADEVSAIPRYMMGDERAGGAGRTASGLSMMMSNASKVLQNVARNVDHDIFEPLLKTLHTYMMLTDTTGIFRGDEDIYIRGVTVASQEETMRMRQLEFLQLTGNPIDLQLVGLEGRAKILKEIAENLGMDGETIVKTPEMLQAEQAQQQMMMGEKDSTAQGPGAQQLPAPGRGEPIAQARTNTVPNNSGI